MDEFGAGQKKQVPPAEPNTVLKSRNLVRFWRTMTNLNTGQELEKMMHVVRWSRPEIYDASNCERHMMHVGKTHYNAMINIMNYCAPTPERGLVLKPYNNWDGISKEYKFEVTVKTDSDYTKCPDTRRSMTGSVVYWNEVPH